MAKASDDLKHEHEAILFALKVLEVMNGRIAAGRDKIVRDALAMVEFLKLFADKCHHGKEEGIYFPALEEAGIPKQGGPIGVMLEEHEAGRGYIKQMQGAIKDSAVQKEKFIKSSGGYIVLLRNHIEKENTVLFPMGDERLSEEKQNELLKLFEEFEETVIGKGKHEELHKMLDYFNDTYIAE